MQEEMGMGGSQQLSLNISCLLIRMYVHLAFVMSR